MEKPVKTAGRNYLIFHLREMGGTEQWMLQLPKAMADLKGKTPPILALDFDGVESLHSRGLNYLTHLLKELEPKETELCLLRVNHSPRQVLAVSRLDSHLHIFLNEGSFQEYAGSQAAQASPVAAPEPAPELETPETRALRKQIEEIKAAISAQEKELARFKQRHSATGLNALLASEEKMMLEIIPLLDDLDRALQHKEQPLETLKEGLALIKNKYQAVLTKYGA
jgi:anti-anti-sigma regulatory factor